MFEILHLSLREYWSPCGFLLIFMTSSFFSRSFSNFFVNSSSRASSFAIFDVKICFGKIENKWESICSDIFSIFCWDIFGMYI